ncbi:MAG: DMT family transporter [Verrucomicrobia bacterium]|nr:MAG: DMT family transporter [Verrucomicrobiota bacterium]
MNPRVRNWIEVNLAVLLWAGTALFPKVIELPVPQIIWGRSVVAAGTLALFLWATGQPLRTRGRRELGLVVGTGICLAAHWLTYYQAIRVSTVATAIIALHTYPFLTILMEPWLSGERVRGADVGLGVVVLVGVAILTPDFDWSNPATQGVALGVVSAFFFALRNLGTRRAVQQMSGSALLFHQTWVVALVLTPWAWIPPGRLSAGSAGWLVLLGVVFTALPHTLFTSGHRHLRAKTVSIVATLLPVYGALSAFLLLGERPGWRTLAGGVVVLAAVVAETLRSVRGPAQPTAPAARAT